MCMESQHLRITVVAIFPKNGLRNNLRLSWEKQSDPHYSSSTCCALTHAFIILSHPQSAVSSSATVMMYITLPNYCIARNIHGLQNLMVWPQTEHKTVLAKFKFISGISQRIMSSWTLRACLSGSVAVLSLEVLEQSCEFTRNVTAWQCASARLASSHRGVPSGAKSATVCIRHYAFWIKIVWQLVIWWF